MFINLGQFFSYFVVVLLLNKLTSFMAKNIAPNITITCPDNCSHPTPRVRARGYGGACKTGPKRTTEQRAQLTGSLMYVALWIPKFFPFTEIFLHGGFIEMAPYTYLWNSRSFFLKIKKKTQLSLHTFRNLTICLHNTYLYFRSFSQNINAIISSITTFQIWRSDVGEPGLTTVSLLTDTLIYVFDSAF